MAIVEDSIVVSAPRDVVWGILRDQEWRPRFLPDGWQYHGPLTGETDHAGARMEIEWRLGPGRTRQVIETLSLDEDEIVEGPPTGDNFITTWKVVERQGATLVNLRMEFS